MHVKDMAYDDSGAVRPDQSSLVLGLEDVDNTNHVVLGNSFGDTDDEADFSCDGFLDGGCSN